MHRLIKLTLIVGVVFIAVLALVRIGVELIRPLPKRSATQRL